MIKRDSPRNGLAGIFGSSPSGAIHKEHTYFRVYRKMAPLGLEPRTNRL